MTFVAFRKVLWISFGAYVLIYIFLYQLAQISKPNFFADHEFLSYDLDKEEPQDLNQKCKIPRIHPFDASILKYLTPPKPIVCKKRIPALTFISEAGVLKFNLTAVQLAGYEVEKLNCFYKEIILKNDFEATYGQKKKIPANGTTLSSDFVSVACSNFAGVTFYFNAHSHIHPKQISFKKEVISNDSAAMYNVLIFGIDSLSRQSFMRHLPKTYKFLKTNLSAFVFRGMTKVGDNTFPNLVAILTGKSTEGKELPQVNDPHGTYDAWPFLWKNFSDSGFATLLAEDRPDINTFTLNRGGFKNPPTDHYMRPFWLVVQPSRLHRYSSRLCFGSTPKHLLQIRYTKDFVAKYSKANQPSFAFSFLVELSHDYIERVTSADDDLENWLRDMLESGHLKRTFLFFLSDHGHRFNSIRSTLVGRIEERMPFSSLVVPKSILDSHQEVHRNLLTNQRRLTTPYDIHFTVLDILNYSRNLSHLGSQTSSRGSSLFGGISPNRSCNDAGIPDHYCVCEEEKQIKVKDPRSRKAASVLVSSINRLLYHHRIFCSRLRLAEVRRADLIVPSQEMVANSWIQHKFGAKDADGARIRIIVRTVPGNGLFEGTLQFSKNDGNVSVVGDISRINRYGSQSSCIQHPTLRKFCYCL